MERRRVYSREQIFRVTHEGSDVDCDLRGPASFSRQEGPIRMRNFIHVSVTYRLNVSNNIPGTGRDRDSISQDSDVGEPRLRWPLVRLED